MRNAIAIRLAYLMRRLDAGEWVSLVTLAHEQSVCPRTVYRNLTALQEAGWPLISKGSSWRLDRDRLPGT